MIFVVLPTVRRGSTFAEAPLRQAFQMLTANTPLENAELVATELAARAACGGCGYSQEITADDLIGHLFVCLSCGTSEEIDEAHGLELSSVTIERPELCARNRTDPRIPRSLMYSLKYGLRFRSVTWVTLIRLWYAGSLLAFPSS